MPSPLTLSMPSALPLSRTPVLRISTRRMMARFDLGVILMPSRPVSRISRSSITTSEAPVADAGPPWYQSVWSMIA
jgi:hypothetical protein